MRSVIPWVYGRCAVVSVFLGVFVGGSGFGCSVDVLQGVAFDSENELKMLYHIV
jgi:hypothetical protein